MRNNEERQKIMEEKQEALIKFLEALEASEDVDAVYHDA